MKHYNYQWIEEWCQDNGWTDLFMERSNNYWAFPPGGVIPEPIPGKVLNAIKAEKGLTPQERIWSLSAVIATMLAAGVTYWLRCPIPMVAAFAFNAVTVAQLEVEDAY
ncbi:MAG: hypothetical protein ACFB02_16430 [Mastigocoleus sp.]